MKNAHLWRTTKYAIATQKGIKITASRRASAGPSLLATTLVARWYSKVIPTSVRGRVLDLGCGTAPLYQAYALFAHEVLCSDWPSSLHGQYFLDFACDLNCGIPLSAQSVDTVIMSDVLEHIYNPWLALKEINRILKPDGRVILNVPFLYWVHEEPHDYYRYTQFAVSKMASDAGFQVERLDAVGGPVLSIADMMGKLIHFVPILGPALAAWMQRIVLLFHEDIPTSKRFPIVIAAVLIKP